MNDNPQSNSSPTVGNSFDIPEPNAKSLFSIRWHKLLTRRVNALLNLIAVPATANAPVMVSDSNALLPVAGTGATTGSGGNPGMIYMGTWNSTTTYSKGNVVRLKSGSSQGVWVLVALTNTGTSPVWPEPADSGGTNTWELLAIGPATFTGCAGGSSHTFTVAMWES